MTRNRADYARLALAAIRLANGTAALLAPASFARRVGIEPEAQPGSLYAFRLFGVRTIVIGAELLSSERARTQRALRAGVAIHAVDAASAALAGLTRQLPPRGAAAAFGLSTLNALLARAALRED
jgi:hypothetical protein